MPAQSPRTFDNQHNQRLTEKPIYDLFPRARMLWYNIFLRARRRYDGFWLFRTCFLRERPDLPNFKRSIPGQLMEGYAFFSLLKTCVLRDRPEV